MLDTSPCLSPLDSGWRGVGPGVSGAQRGRAAVSGGVGGDRGRVVGRIGRGGARIRWSRRLRCGWWSYVGCIRGGARIGCGIGWRERGSTRCRVGRRSRGRWCGCVWSTRSRLAAKPAATAGRPGQARARRGCTSKGQRHLRVAEDLHTAYARISSHTLTVRGAAHGPGWWTRNQSAASPSSARSFS